MFSLKGLPQVPGIVTPNNLLSNKFHWNKKEKNILWKVKSFLEEDF